MKEVALQAGRTAKTCIYSRCTKWNTSHKYHGEKGKKKLLCRHSCTGMRCNIMAWSQLAYSGINEPITLMQYLQELTVAVSNVSLALLTTWHSKVSVNYVWLTSVTLLFSSTLPQSAQTRFSLAREARFGSLMDFGSYCQVFANW